MKKGEASKWLLTVALATTDNSLSSKAGDNDVDNRPNPNDNYILLGFKKKSVLFYPSSSLVASSLLLSKGPLLTPTSQPGLSMPQPHWDGAVTRKGYLLIVNKQGQTQTSGNCDQVKGDHTVTQWHSLGH